MPVLMDRQIRGVLQRVQQGPFLDAGGYFVLGICYAATGQMKVLRQHGQQLPVGLVGIRERALVLQITDLVIADHFDLGIVGPALLKDEARQRPALR